MRVYSLANPDYRKSVDLTEVLFVGVESAYDDVFADVEIDEDERQESRKWKKLSLLEYVRFKEDICRSARK